MRGNAPKARARRRVKRLARFEVELLEPFWDDGLKYIGKPLGSVLLFWESTHAELEHALATVGVYAPRGLDWAEWFAPTRVCVIRDAGNQPIVRLTERPSP